MRAVQLACALSLLMATLCAASPASGGVPSAPTRKRRKTPRPAVSSSEASSISASHQLPDEADASTAAAAAVSDDAPSATVARSASRSHAAAPSAMPPKAKKRRKRAQPPPPPPPSLSGSLLGGLSRIRDGAESAYRSKQEAWAVQEEERKLEALRERRRAAARLRKLREEVEALEQAAGEGEASGMMEGEVVDDEEAPPLSLAERGALIGSVLLSPAGMAGLIVGGTFGGVRRPPPVGSPLAEPTRRGESSTIGRRCSHQ